MSHTHPNPNAYLNTGNTVMVIVLCPCCASPQDARPSQQPQQFGCVACGQRWQMPVDGERFLEHSLH